MSLNHHAVTSVAARDTVRICIADAARTTAMETALLVVQDAFLFCLRPTGALDELYQRLRRGHNKFQSRPSGDTLTICARLSCADPRLIDTLVFICRKAVFKHTGLEGRDGHPKVIEKHRTGSGG